MAIGEAQRRQFFAQRMTAESGLKIDETIGGLVLVVLGILALARLYPPVLNAIATIVAGVALLVVSAGLGLQLSRTLSETAGHAIPPADMDTGVNAGMLGGIVGVVLGILAILGVATLELIAVALIVFGAAVLFDCIMVVQLRALRMTVEGPAGSSRSATSKTLVGFTLIILGIVALSGVASEILASVALLGLGAYLFMEGAAVAGSMTSWTTWLGRGE
jgi:hypothetical protein